MLGHAQIFLVEVHGCQHHCPHLVTTTSDFTSQKLGFFLCEMEATMEVGELSIQSPLDRSIQSSVAVSPSITCIQFQLPYPPPSTLQYAPWHSPDHTPRSELQKQHVYSFALTYLLKTYRVPLSSVAR